MVVGQAIANHVRPNDFSAVILDFVVTLRRALRRKKVWPGDQSGVTHEDFRVDVGERKSTSSGRINNLILELQVSEPDLVGEGAGIKVGANNYVTGNVLVVVKREPLPKCCT